MSICAALEISRSRSYLRKYNLKLSELECKLRRSNQLCGIWQVVNSVAYGTQSIRQHWQYELFYASNYEQKQLTSTANLVKSRWLLIGVLMSRGIKCLNAKRINNAKQQQKLFFN